MPATRPMPPPAPAQAELEHAQLEGRKESLALAEEGIVVQVPLGAGARPAWVGAACFATPVPCCDALWRAVVWCARVPLPPACRQALPSRSSTHQPPLPPQPLSFFPAEFIMSPSGHLYHIRWGQDPDTGELRLADYWRDPVSSGGGGTGARAGPVPGVAAA